MQLRYPLYIISKGRWESRLTSKALDRMGVDYRMVVEAQEFDQYAAVIDPVKLLVLDSTFQRDYDALGETTGITSKGSGPARNFVWAHAIATGAERHWILDDNIRCFYRLIHNQKIRVWNSVFFRAMEDFVDRYQNIAMAGPNYQWLAKERQPISPLIVNSRIYSCILIDNALPYRWRGRFNEDTILSLDLLKAGWCTVAFNAFLQDKQVTQSMRGGNTDTIYVNGTLEKSKMLVREHPDVARLVWKFGRWHHHVDYRRFKKNRLKLKPGIVIPQGVNEYGMKLVNVADRTPVTT